MKLARFAFLRHPARLLFAAGFLAVHTVAQAADKIGEWVKLMPENAMIIVGIKDTPELVKDWDTSGMGRFMEDEAVKRWMAPMYKDGQSAWDKFFGEMTGTTLREALGLYPGASLGAIIVDDIEDFEADEPRHVGLSEIAGNEAAVTEAKAKQLEAYKKNEYPDAVLKTKEIDGVTVSYISDGDEEDAWWVESWAVVDGLLVETVDEELMTEMISRVKGAQGDGHPAAAHFARLAEIRGGTADVTIYGDLDSLFAMMEEKFEEDAGNKPSPITPKQVFGALSLEELHGVAACIELNDGHARGDLVILHEEKPQGIFPALVRGTSTEVPQPPFVPAEVDSSSVTRASPGAIYDNVFKTVNKLGPIAAILTGQLEGLEKQAGISIRQDLLGSMDDEYLEMTKMVPGQANPQLAQNQVTAFKLKNRDRFQSSFDALWKLIGNGFGVFEESEYEGHKIFTMKSSLSGGQADGAPAPRFGYVITDEYVFLVQGAPDLLHKVLGRLKDSPPGTSLWDQPQSQTALAALPRGFTGMGVSNGGSILRTMLTTMAAAQNMVPGKSAAAKAGKKSPKGPKAKPGASEDEGEGASAGGVWFDAEATPPDDTFDRYFGVGASGVYSHPDATQILYISQPAEKK